MRLKHAWHPIDQEDDVLAPSLCQHLIVLFLPPSPEIVLFYPLEVVGTVTELVRYGKMAMLYLQERTSVALLPSLSYAL